MNLQQPVTALEQHVIPEKKQSGLGIASFIIALVGGFVMFAVFGIAGYLEHTMDGGMTEESPEAVLVGLAMMGDGLLVLLGLGLGIAGLFQSDRKKLFAILGLALNGLIVLGAAGLVAIGMLAE